MKNFFLIALTAILLPALAFAQFSISGSVAEKNTPDALAGASIRLNNSFLSTQTNAEGNFNLKNIRPGTYSLTISYIGFKTTTQQVTVTGNLVLAIELEPESYLSDEVVVQSTRAPENSATTYRNISKEELEKNNLGQDLPFLLNQTPSVVVTSDAGAGVGYTGIRIRGSDPTRINMTINGIPYNESESQGTFLVNLPDFASSVDNIQIQRGVGTSTNGAGAFGGSLNVQTTTRRDSAYAELNNSAGSYQTLKNTVNVGTGLINERFSFDGRLSRIQSDGYIDRASSRLRSYFLSGAYYGKNSLLRANVFSGAEKTYQAWNGVPQTLLNTNRTFNGFNYENQTDNYTQDHYQLIYSRSFSPKISFNGALHYTYGRGYYEEYMEEDDLANYGISPVVIGENTVEQSNLIRRRWLDNDFYGLTYSLNYVPLKNLNFTLGGAYNEYSGDHFGEVIKGQYVPVELNQQRYYNGNGFKTDFNIYGKASYQLGKTSLFADMQYRRIDYRITGTDKNRNILGQTDLLNFFNPKVGVSYQANERNNLYASFAMANKEPNRDDYINSTPATRPQSENLQNIEAGYRTGGQRFNAGINGYYMDYKDQQVLTGKVNDVGEYIRQNVSNSYRLGIEVDGKIQLADQFYWATTAALSKNKIKTFTEFVDDYDNGGQIATNYDDTDIAFSPSFIGSSELNLKPFENAEIALLSKYVGRQYMDNTTNSSRKLDAFFVNDVRLGYTTSFKNIRKVGLVLLVNNVFGELYETNGYTFSYVADGGFATENFYYPQATRNFLISLSLGL